MNPAIPSLEQVKAVYSQIAEAPADHPPFPTGRRLAQDLGYPPDLLDRLPAVAVEAFSGVSNVSDFAEIEPEAVVLDLGCGAGLEALIAATRASRVVAVDFSAAMLGRAQRAVRQAGLEAKIQLLQAEAQRLPLAGGSIDVALVNGLFNLNPEREQIFAELARVVRPGGKLFCAEIVLKKTLPLAEAQDPGNWFT